MMELNPNIKKLTEIVGEIEPTPTKIGLKEMIKYF